MDSSNQDKQLVAAIVGQLHLQDMLLISRDHKPGSYSPGHYTSILCYRYCHATKIMPAKNIQAQVASLLTDMFKGNNVPYDVYADYVKLKDINDA